MELEEIINNLKIEINEEDMDEQEKYFQILDKLIDGVIRVRLMQYKRENNTMTIHDIDTYVDTTFHFANSNESYVSIKELIDKLYNFVNECNKNGKSVIDYDYLEKRINWLFQIYCHANYIPYNMTTEVYNELLNRFDDTFISNEKDRVIKELKNYFPLALKKQRDILLAKKLARIESIFINGEYEKLDTSYDELIKMGEKVIPSIMGLKEIRKNGIKISDDVFFKFSTLFATGKLEEKYFTSLLPKELVIIEPKIGRKIMNKYMQLLLTFVSNINLTKEEEMIDDSYKGKYGFDYNNYLIASNEKVEDNLKELMYSIKMEDIEDILINNYQELKCFLPFINIFPEFKTEDFIGILKTYNRVVHKIKSLSKGSKDNDIDFAIKHFGEILSFSKGYNLATSLKYALLSSYVANTVLESRVSEYAKFYLEVFKKRSSFIPMINGSYANVTYESGDFLDPKRLLIGLYCKDSCIDLFNPPGRKTYEEVLTKKTGNVLMIRDKNSHDFVARTLMFRRGNVVMLAPFYNSLGKIETSLMGNKEFIDKIGKEIMSAVFSSDDNIDFLFLTTAGIGSAALDYDVICDRRFTSELPHADITNYAYLLCATKEIEMMDFNTQPKVEYKKVREPVSDVLQPEKYSRLKAVMVMQEPDLIKRNELINEYEPFWISDGKYVYSGDDWYIAVKDGLIVEEVIIPDYDDRCLKEFNQVKQMILNSKEDVVKR